ncbi:PorP/SprF family type IX secretion system membrane protein [Aquimarina aquimarini]|uniref:PorP/SprF family type IX secretion system membrane protein n=1 Tax=Aquimarina aquimarini TaxID=1191734 RepID=UPI000D54D96D|nr:PorP/SprF family type IX secretion system membrane protein [Aquimarina aquimarini]
MVKKLLLIIVCISFNLLRGQDENTTTYGVLPTDIPTHNLVKYNRFYFNPTFSLVRENKKSINVYNKTQWASFNDNPQTYLINYTANFDEQIGVSIGLHQQNEGIYRYFGGIANFAYNVEIDRDMNLTFGMNLGFSQSGIKSNIDAATSIILNSGVEVSDPVILNYEKSSVFQLTPGANFNYAEFDVGVSVSNLVAYNLTASELLTDNMAFRGHVMYTTSLQRRSDKTIRGMVYANMLPDTGADSNLRYGGNVIVDLPELGWAQAGYNSFYGASVGIGGNITSNVSVGYTYETGLGDTSNFGATHEVSLAYNFEKERPRKRRGRSKSSTQKAYEERDSEIRRLKKEILEQNKLIRELQQEKGESKSQSQKAMSELERSIAEAKEKEAKAARELELQREEEVKLLNKRREEERLASRQRLEREEAEQKAEAERIASQQRLERETAQQQAEAERVASQQRLERETAEQKAEAERLAAQQRIERETTEQRATEQRIAAEEAAREAEAAAQQEIEERLAAQREIEREEAEQKAEAERVASQQRLEREVAERAAAQQAEEERIQQEAAAEAERVASQQRLEREVAERAAAQQAEEERIQQEAAAEAERLAAQQRLEREVAERAAAQQAEEERVQQEAAAEAERLEAQRRLEREVAVQEAAQQAEEERIQQEAAAEAARLEAQRKLEREVAVQEAAAEAARLAEEERLRQEAAEAARLAEEERLRQEAAAEAARLAEEERLRQEAAAEAARLAEEERLRQEAAAEAARLAEEERLRQEAAAEAARLAEEERQRQEAAEAARLAEEERQRQEAAEAARLAEEERQRQEAAAEAARLAEEERQRQAAAANTEENEEGLDEIKKELDNSSRITDKIFARRDSLLNTSMNVDKREFSKLLESLVSMDTDAEEAKNESDPASSKRLTAKNRFVKFAETSRPQAQFATKYIPGYPEGYYLIGNVFKGGAYADKFTGTLKDLGFNDSQIILNPENQFQYVAIESYTDKDEAAEKYFNNIDNRYFGDMWILHIAKNRVESYKKLLQETRLIKDTVKDDTVLTESLSFIGGHNIENGYYLITNIFKRENYFERGMAKLRSQGLEPQYFRNPKDNYIYVYLKRYGTIDEAKQSLFSNVNNSYDGDLYILKVQ